MFLRWFLSTRGLPRWFNGKRIHLSMQETWVQSQGWEDPLEKEMASLSSILAWEIPWQRNLVGHSPRGHKELDTTEQLSMHVSTLAQCCACGLTSQPEHHWHFEWITNSMLPGAVLSIVRCSAAPLVQPAGCHGTPLATMITSISRFYQMSSGGENHFLLKTAGLVIVNL